MLLRGGKRGLYIEIKLGIQQIKLQNTIVKQEHHYLALLILMLTCPMREFWNIETNLNVFRVSFLSFFLIYHESWHGHYRESFYLKLFYVLRDNGLSSNVFYKACSSWSSWRHVWFISHHELSVEQSSLLVIYTESCWHKRPD